MIITDPLKARMKLDLIYVGDADARTFAYDELSKMLVHEGENVGAFINPRSMYVTEHQEDFGIVLTAMWCPDPREGVEFRGGPNDGKILGFGDKHEPPLDFIRLPPEPTPPSFDSSPYPTRTMDIAGYRRAGIDSEKDRWVYVSA